jgi:tetratricopeptide (TPR) repeat protein
VTGKGYEIALKVIRTAEKKSAMQDPYNLLAAKCLYMTDKVEDAIPYLLAAEAKEGKTLKTMEVRGRCHLRLQQFDQALVTYSEAIKLDSKNPQSYFNRALAFIALKQYPQALTDLETSLKIAPSFVLATQKLREVKQLLLGSKAG